MCGDKDGVGESLDKAGDGDDTLGGDVIGP